jgi:hypothetical protein
MKKGKKKSDEPEWWWDIDWGIILRIVLLLAVEALYAPASAAGDLLRLFVLTVLVLHLSQIKKWWKDKTAAAAAAVGGAKRLNMMILLLMILIFRLFVVAIRTIFRRLFNAIHF